MTEGVQLPSNCACIVMEAWKGQQQSFHSRVVGITHKPKHRLCGGNPFN
jgi:hypothetical protein